MGVDAWSPTTRKLLSIGLFAFAGVWAAEVVRQALATDDGGPPIAALCVCCPALFAVIAAGAVWPTPVRGRAPGWLVGLVGLAVVGVLWWLKRGE
jgi:hypothetical protein